MLWLVGQLAPYWEVISVVEKTAPRFITVIETAATGAYLKPA